MVAVHFTGRNRIVAILWLYTLDFTFLFADWSTESAADQ
jgi:hypothetical protein